MNEVTLIKKGLFFIVMCMCIGAGGGGGGETGVLSESVIGFSLEGQDINICLCSALCRRN